MKRLVCIFLSFLLCASAWGAVELTTDLDYLTVADSASLDITDALTVLVRITILDRLSLQGILSKGRQYTGAGDIQGPYAIGVYAKDWYAQVGDGTAAVTATATAANDSALAEYHDLVLRFDGSTVKIYEDGVEFASAAAVFTLGTNALPVFIGCGGNANSGNPDYALQGGTIHEVAIWNIALDVPEIQQLSSGKIRGLPLQVQSANLKLYLPLDEHPNQTGINNLVFKDLSGNGNDGTGVDIDDDSTVIGETVLSYPSRPIMSN